jgi:hypothetical protein
LEKCARALEKATYPADTIFDTRIEKKRIVPGEILLQVGKGEQVRAVAPGCKAGLFGMVAPNHAYIRTLFLICQD